MSSEDQVEELKRIIEAERKEKLAVYLRAHNEDE